MIAINLSLIGFILGIVLLISMLAYLAVMGEDADGGATTGVLIAVVALIAISTNLFRRPPWLASPTTIDIGGIIPSLAGNADAAIFTAFVFIFLFPIFVGVPLTLFERLVPTPDGYIKPKRRVSNGALLLAFVVASIILSMVFVVLLGETSISTVILGPVTMLFVYIDIAIVAAFTSSLKRMRYIIKHRRAK